MVGSGQILKVLIEFYFGKILRKKASLETSALKSLLLDLKIIDTMNIKIA